MHALAVLPLLLAPQESDSNTWLEHFQHAEALLAADDTPAAIAALESSLTLAPECATSAYHLACAHARRGDDDAAYTWLERAVEWGWIDADVIEWDPDLGSLRDDPRTAALVEHARAAAEHERVEARILTYASLDFPRIDPTGERVFTGRGGDGYLWDLATGTLLAVMDDFGRGVDFAEFDPRGEVLVADGYDGEVFLYDARTGELRMELDDPAAGLCAVRFLGDALLLGDGLRGDTPRLYELPTGERIGARFGRSSDGLYVSPDGQRVLTLTRETATLWTADGAQVARIPTKGIPMHTVGFSPDGGQGWLRNAYGVQWFDAADGTVLREIAQSEGGHTVGVALTADHELITVHHSDGAVRWWSVDGDAPHRELYVEPFTSWGSATLDAEGTRMLSAGYSVPTRLWNLVDGTILREWPGEGHGLGTRIDERSGLALVSNGNRTLLEVVDPLTGQTLHSLRQGQLRGGWSRAAPDDRTVCVPADDGSLRFFELATGETVRVLRGHGATVQHVDWSWDGTLLATGSDDGTARIWDVDRERAIATLPAFDGGRASWSSLIALHPDEDRLATYGAGDTARVWSIDTESILFEVGHDASHLDWSPDGRWIAAACKDATARVLDSRTGAEVAALEHPDRIDVLAFDDQGRRLAVAGSSERVTVYDTATWRIEEICELRGDFLFGCRAAQLEWTSRGDLLVTTSGWGTVNCFDRKTLVCRWHVEMGGGNAADLYALPSADGARVYVSGQTSQSTRVVDVETGEEVVGFAERSYFLLSATDDERALLTHDGGTVVLDGESFEERYTRTEWSDGGALVHLDCGLYSGSLEAVRGAHLVVGAEVVGLDDYAPLLYAPRRVLAAAAGVAVRAPRIPPPPAPPTLTPVGRYVDAEGAVPLEIAFELGEAFFLTLQLRDYDPQMLSAAASPLTFEVSGLGPIDLQVRTVSRAGVTSRPALLTLRFPDE